MSSYWRKIISSILIVFILLLVVFITIWTRAFFVSKGDFIQGKAYYSKRQYIKAITFFDRSMHWYAPFNPYIEKSAGYLWEISKYADENNDEQLSIIAIETIKNSFYSSRSLYSPGICWIKRSDDKIMNILRRQNNRTSKNSGLDVNERIYEQNLIYNDPAILWTIILEIGLFGWIGATIGLILLCLNPRHMTNKYIRSYWLWILLAGINYCLWIIGMIKA